MCARDKAGEALRPVAPPPQGKALANGKTSRIIQYYRLKQKHSALRGTAPKPPVLYTPDWLAVMTARSKACLDLAAEFFSKFEKSAPKRMLPNFKNLTHLIIPLALSVIVASLAAKQFSPVPEQRNKIWVLFYLISFAIHFGAQIWMTFVSGLVLYFSLERHVFGQVQEKLFPFFYMFNAIMSCIQILSYINTQPTIALDSKPMEQIAVMTLSLVIELYIRLYISHQIVLLKHKKTRIEAEAGTGHEIGQHILGELANCPHYMGILRKFRRLHSYTSIATIVTVICSAYHINYLTDKLCI